MVPSPVERWFESGYVRCELQPSSPSRPRNVNGRETPGACDKNGAVRHANSDRSHSRRAIASGWMSSDAYAPADGGKGPLWEPSEKLAAEIDRVGTSFALVAAGRN